MMVVVMTFGGNGDCVHGTNDGGDNDNSDEGYGDDNDEVVMIVGDDMDEEEEDGKDEDESGHRRLLSSHHVSTSTLWAGCVERERKSASILPVQWKQSTGDHRAALVQWSCIEGGGYRGGHGTPSLLKDWAPLPLHIPSNPRIGEEA
jgi:hypothetical protein